MKNFLKKKMSLRVVLVSFVFLILLATMLIMGTIAFVAVKVVGTDFFRGPNPLPPIVILFLFSVLLGTVLAAVVSNRTLKPLRKVIDAMQKVAAGDFSVQLTEESIPEIEDLTNSFNTMVIELGSIETLRSDFISNFSHEFKTPIVSIRGFAKLLRNKSIAEADKDEYIEIIIQESERLAGLSTNVLNLSKLETIEILADKEYFFLDEQIRRAASLLEPRWREKGIEVTLEMDSVTLYSDEDLLQQVWVNLIENAIKYTQTGGNISIMLKRHADTVDFIITDTGCGMSEQTLAHLFDKFYQGDKSHSGIGNGLGLTMVKRITMLCGGNIDVQSAQGKGSEFTVTLPIGIEKA